MAKRKPGGSRKRIQKHSITFFHDDVLQKKIERVESMLPPFAKFDKAEVIRTAFVDALDEIIKHLEAAQGQSADQKALVDPAEATEETIDAERHTQDNVRNH